MAPTCRRSCRRGRAPGQSSAPTATGGGRGWAGRSPSQWGARARVPAAPQPHVGVCLSRPSRPVPPVVRPLPPTSLGFLPEETREAAPDPHVSGAAGTGRQGMPSIGLLLALDTTLAAETGIQGSVAPPSTGWCLPEHLSWGRPAPPVPSSITLKAVLANVPSTHIRHLWPPPALTPMGHPMVLPTPVAGPERWGPHIPHRDRACPRLPFERLLAAIPPRRLPRSFVSADAQETPFSYSRPAQLEGPGLEACRSPLPRRT